MWAATRRMVKFNRWNSRGGPWVTTWNDPCPKIVILTRLSRWISRCLLRRYVWRCILTLSKWLLLLVECGYVLGLLLILLWHHSLGTWLSKIVVIDVGWGYRLLQLLIFVSGTRAIAVRPMLRLLLSDWWSTNFARNFTSFVASYLLWIHSVLSFYKLRWWEDIQWLLTAWLVVNFDRGTFRGTVLIFLASIYEIVVVACWSWHLLVSLAVKFVQCVLLWS